MRYRLLLWPHANARYQQETRKLAQAELELMLARLAPGARCAVEEGADMPCLTIDAPDPLDAGTVEAVRRHSLLYGLFEARDDGSLVPVTGRAATRLGPDLPAILKYKGKTNELFLQLLINAALYAGDYWDADGPLELLDPMCGRATAPFIALNLGWNAVGADVDRADLKEAERFFRRYLEYHRFKHAVSSESRTIRAKKPAPVTRFELADTPEHFKKKQIQTLRLVHMDAADAGDAFGRDAFHMIVCDLPYGVRHDAQLQPGAKPDGKWLEALLAASLKGFGGILRPGGTVAMSFNAQTLSRSRLRGMMEDAGFQALSGGAYDRFAHWVEQAITRDIAICRKPR